MRSDRWRYHVPPRSAHQRELDMIPLKMTSNYQPNGWLGLIMGTRMYYSFSDADTLDEASFQGRVDKVVREIGDRGMGPDKTLSSKPAAAREDAVQPPRDVRAAWAAAPSERVPPAPAPAPAPVTPAAATTHQERFTPSIQTAAPARTLPLPLEAQGTVVASLLLPLPLQLLAPVRNTPLFRAIFH